MNRRSKVSMRGGNPRPLHFNFNEHEGEMKRWAVTLPELLIWVAVAVIILGATASWLAR